MRKTFRKTAAAVATGAALGGLAFAGPGVAGAVTPFSHAAAQSARGFGGQVLPGSQLWVRRYHTPGDGIDNYAIAVGVSPAGGRVYVTGTSAGVMTPGNVATVSYDAATGRQVWQRIYRGPEGRDTSAAGLAVGPGGRAVYVTGESSLRASGHDFSTVAYRAGTGRLLWQACYDGPASKGDGARSVAVSPDGKTVFVTGYSWGRLSTNTHVDADYATVAYAAATGRQIWASRYDGPARPAASIDEPTSVAVGPGGRTVYVAGRSRGRTSGFDYVTVAYRAATGRQLWVSRYNGPANASDEPASLAVGPRGGTVYVTGTSIGRAGGQDYATVAYDAATGQRRWAERYVGPRSGSGGAASVAVSPGGGMVFVTGRIARAASTIAYRASTGARVWVRNEQGGNATSVAAGRDGHTIFITGNGYMTIAYDASTGAKLWIRHYSGPNQGPDFATSVAAGPGGKVFVTGSSAGRDNLGDFATVAYSN